MDLLLTTAFWLGCINLGRTFSRGFAEVLEIIFASTLISDIGRQFHFLISLLSFPFSQLNSLWPVFVSLRVPRTHKSSWCNQLKVFQSKTKTTCEILLSVHRSREFYFFFFWKVCKTLKHLLYSIFPSHFFRKSSVKVGNSFKSSRKDVDRRLLYL